MPEQEELMKKVTSAFSAPEMIQMGPRLLLLSPS